MRMLPRSPEYWLGKAEEARVVAEGMRSVDGRRTMLDIAAQYEVLAERIREFEQIFGSLTRRATAPD
jgi:hypothetical protein